MEDAVSDTVHTVVQQSNVDRGVPRILPTGAALGARVEGVDVRSLDTETFALVYQAWLDHQVLLFRDQSLTDEDLLAFSRRFGHLDEAPVQESGRRFVEGHPEIYVVSNVVEHGVPIGSLGAGEAVWHTDMLVPAGSAEGERSLCAGSAGSRWRYRLLLDVCRVG